MSEIRYKDKYIQKLTLLFLKENNISDNNYFNCDYLNLIDLDENVGVLLELMYKTKFNIIPNTYNFCTIKN
jgi:hypothetical protein